MEMPIEKVERYKSKLIEFIEGGEHINTLEAVGIKSALTELTDYKRFASISDVSKVFVEEDY